MTLNYLNAVPFTSYIEESFEDWDLKMPPIEIKKSLKNKIKFNDDLRDDAKPSYDGKLNFNEIVSKLSRERATIYYYWFYIGVPLLIYITVKL